MQKKRSPELSAALRRLGNPYAAIQFEEEYAELELRPLNAHERSYVRRLGNQYAPLSIGIVSDKSTEAVGRRSAARNGVSASAFAAECRRIFKQYIPLLENGRLRQHYKEFIERNQKRSALARQYLVNELQRYDLARIGDVRGHFNREDHDLTSDKLRQIESKVIGDK